MRALIGKEAAMRALMMVVAWAVLAVASAGLAAGFPAAGNAPRRQPQIVTQEAQAAILPPDGQLIRDPATKSGYTVLVPPRPEGAVPVIWSHMAAHGARALTARVFLRAAGPATGGFGFMIMRDKIELRPKSGGGIVIVKTWEEAGKIIVTADDLRQFPGYSGWDVKFQGTGRDMKGGICVVGCPVCIERVAIGSNADIRAVFGPDAAEVLKQQKRKAQ